MKATYTNSISGQRAMNRILMYAFESLVLFLILLGTMSVFAQTAEKNATTTSTAATKDDGQLVLVKQSIVYNSGKVYLNWVTKANSNDCVYVVERSVDGDEYEPVGLKEGIGSPIELLYSWIDNQPKEGASYYRIKQVNMDGKLVAQTNPMDMNTPTNPLFLDKGSRMVQVK